MIYKEYLRTDDWKCKRSSKRKNSSGRCAICGERGTLDTHHLVYKNLYNIENSDLRILCRRCHFLSHRLIKEGKIKFRSDNHHSRFIIIKTAVKKELGLAGINLFNIGGDK